MIADNTRRPFIAGNWKMYKTASQAREYILALKELLPAGLAAEVALAPAYPALPAALAAAEGSPIRIAAQNVHWKNEGAYTGEVSVEMLKESGIGLVIIGHSERRQFFGETDETVNLRLKAALAGGLEAIVCVGESQAERESGRTWEVLSAQLAKGLADITQTDLGRVTIAYEPVWAIGTGLTATPELAQDTHDFCRKTLAGLFNKELAKTVRIQYGGSVKPGNAAELLAQPDIDGALVGGASLEPGSFYEIIINGTAEKA